MNEIVVWTHGYHFQNTRSFLFPLIYFKDYLKTKGIQISIYNKAYVPPKKTFLFIESNFFGKKFISESKEIIKLLRNSKKNFYKIIYFDLSDSTSILHPQIIKYVDIYSKSQLLKNRNLYKKKFYGNRIFTNFIFKKYKILDKIESYSDSINDDSIKKLRIHWNSSIGNYTYFGRIMDKLYEKFRIKRFLKLPNKQSIYLEKKKFDLFYNMNIKYSRQTVAWYRKNAFQNLNLIIPERIRTYKYFYQLRRSRVSLSPFGWGEINYRDFESFISCSLLLKPNMSHLETWPNLYKKSNYIAYDWSGEDLKEKFEHIKRNYSSYYKVAQRGHDFYFSQIQTNTLKENILVRLTNLLS